MAYQQFRPDSFPPVVKNLILINVVVYVGQLLFKAEPFNLTHWIQLYVPMPNEARQLIQDNGWIDGYTEGHRFQVWQLITHMFSHSPDLIFHLIFNMFALYTFGRTLENLWGGGRFLFFYLSAGLGAGLLHIAVQAFRIAQELPIDPMNVASVTELVNAAVPAVGASGAVMGVMAAFAYLFPNQELYLMFIPVPIKAKWAILGLIALDVFGAFGNFPGDSIAHFAHLGGAITGFLIVWMWNRNRKQFY